MTPEQARRVHDTVGEIRWTRAELVLALGVVVRQLDEHRATVTTGGPPKRPAAWENVTLPPPESASSPDAPALHRSLS